MKYHIIGLIDVYISGYHLPPTLAVNQMDQYKV